MHSELHCDLHYYDKNFPIVSYPTIIGFMGLDDERRYIRDTSQLKYAKHSNITQRDVNFDLNLHMDQVKRKPHLNEKINHLLSFLVDEKDRLKTGLKPAVDFESATIFCYRGLLTCIANTPYERNDPWKIVATFYQGNIYLCALPTEDKINRELNMSERDKQCSSWGYKFEQFLLSDEPDGEPNPNRGVNEGEEFSLVMATKLNNHNLVYGAEMDGIICDENIPRPPPMEMGSDAIIKYLSRFKFIELKTCAHLQTNRQLNNFRRFKTRKWWLQSYFAGVKNIVCGFRNQEGTVEELRMYQVQELAQMSKSFWRANICINFLDAFLHYIKRCLKKEIVRKYGDKALKKYKSLPLVALHFEWRPNSAIQVTDYCYESDPILPDWFLNSFKNVNIDVETC